ncbi:succinate dehydrogenase/fumarate reductase cytochrome b subunit [soil metagenome]
MSKFFEFLNSSVGRKWLMALTGLFLCLFVTVHMSGNLSLFKNDNGQSFNQYAVFMTTFPPIKVISYLNYAFILLHALNGFYLVLRNRKARPVKYESKKDARSASWSSRNMGILGSILFVFIIVHMGNFWREFHWFPMEVLRYSTDMNTGVTEIKSVPYESFTGPKDYYENGTRIVEVKNLYGEVAEAFKSPLYVLFYVIAMFALSYHLVHGFQSAFQTLGIRFKTYEKIIRGVGTVVYALIIPALFAAMPIYFLFFK